MDLCVYIHYMYRLQFVLLNALRLNAMRCSVLLSVSSAGGPVDQKQLRQR